MRIQQHAVHGATIGNFLGQPIYQTVEEEGQHYVFDRIADGDADGYSLFQLNNDEILIEPGLIYKQSS